ncbi:hypothetical protein HZA33_00260 [Candidatus Pacearchaeota archaeon]|nr:hypothetical protein [Candidatus Pacearchaeota archaeon]
MEFALELEMIPEKLSKREKKDLEGLMKEVSPKIFNEAAHLYFEMPQYYESKREIVEKRAKILHAARIAQQTDFPTKDAFMRVYYWANAYIYDGVNVYQIQKCIDGLDEEIIKELEGEDAYELLCVQCEEHDKCHLENQ